VIEKEFTKFLKIIADGMKTKVGDAVFSKNQSFDTVKAL
jgi:hypothetical protein